MTLAVVKDDMPGRKDDGADGNGTAKLRWSLVPLGPLEAIARVLNFGAAKYAPHNWQKVDNATERYYDAALRHLFAWRKGERLDAETGLPHLAHACTCLLFVLWHEMRAGEAKAAE